MVVFVIAAILLVVLVAASQIFRFQTPRFIMMIVMMSVALFSVFCLTMYIVHPQFFEAEQPVS